jgi:hypothetical protein
MEIANLMLIDTRPVTWDDPYASDCMTDFLLSLLDPEKPGLAMLAGRGGRLESRPREPAASVAGHAGRWCSLTTGFDRAAVTLAP